MSTKIKGLTSRGAAVLPSKGKYGLVSLTGDDDETQILVGPEFYSEARLSDKGIDSDDEEDNDKVEIEKEESESSRHPNAGVKYEKDEMNEINYNKNFEDFENPQIQYGIEYNKQKYPVPPLFTPSYENALSFHLQQDAPYFLPPNSYVPIPIINQYLQRRALYNAALRYPSNISPYPPSSVYYGLQNDQTIPQFVAPQSFRQLFYAPQ